MLDGMYEVQFQLIFLKSIHWSKLEIMNIIVLCVPE